MFVLFPGFRSFFRSLMLGSLFGLLLLPLLRGQSASIIDFMDPETVYSFKGLDGRGFLRRSPVNLPQPVYVGKETGIVALIFEINPAGYVPKLRQETDLVTSANSDMIEAAQVAVEQWKFNPLPPDAEQEIEEVRVVIQYNFTNSGVIYSIDGRFTIEGLRNDRRPVQLAVPEYNTDHEGVVTALLTIEPSGGLAWIDQFYGSYPNQRVVPRLGIITDKAIRKWRFTPLPEGVEQTDQLIKVICRYLKWK